MVALIPTEQKKLSELECGMISLRDFPLRKWYYVSPLWYYHAPATSHQLKLDRKFFELLDPELRNLCDVALKAGICTTPSCQGHFYPQSRFETIWRGLLEDSEKIRGDGLQLTDAETQEKCVFQNADWKLPWSSFEQFHRETDAAQSNGYVGLALPNDRPDLARKLYADSFACTTGRIEFDAELTELLGQPLFGIFVCPSTQAEGAAAWAGITEYLKQVLAAELTRSHETAASAMA